VRRGGVIGAAEAIPEGKVKNILLFALVGAGIVCAEVVPEVCVAGVAPR
jgi:hypothetical protein